MHQCRMASLSAGRGSPRSVVKASKAARVPGVKTTAGAALFNVGPAGFQPVPKDPNTGTQTLTLDKWQLPELMQLDIAVGASTPPATLSHGVGSGSGGTAIPVVPEVC